MSIIEYLNFDRLKTFKSLIIDLINKKADSEALTQHEGNTDIHITTEEKNKLANIDIQSDLSVNNENDPAYVKNRTHWVENEINELLPETTLTSDSSKEDDRDTSDETPVTLTVEGESYIVRSGVDQYTKNEYPNQAAAQFQYTDYTYATYTTDVEIAGIYTLTAIGTGLPAVDGGSIIGDLYIDGIHISHTTLTTNGFYNVFLSENQLVSEFGSAVLASGKHTIKFVVNGGVYVLDKMLFTLRETILPVIRINGEDFDKNTAYRSQSYTPADSDRSGVLIGTDMANSSRATWNVTINRAGTYTVTTFGTGYVSDTIGAGTLQGTLSIISIDDPNAKPISLAVHGYNSYVAYGEVSTLCDFYLTEGEHTITLALPEGRYTMDYMELTLKDNLDVTLPNEISFIVGGEYIVNYNGIEYVCKGQDFSHLQADMVGIGNAGIVGLTDTGEPFIIYTIQGIETKILILDGSDEATISIKEIAETFKKKLNEKFLPKLVGESTAGKVYTIRGRVVAAKDGAEIFNNKRNIAFGLDSHAKGHCTIAIGDVAYAEGLATQASGYISHVEGLETIAASEAQHVQGKYNVKDSEGKYAHIVGNGDSSGRSNAHTLDWDGNSEFAGDVIANGCGGDNPVSLLGLSSKIEGMFVTLTQAEYDALEIKDENTFYFTYYEE